MANESSSIEGEAGARDKEMGPKRVGMLRPAAAKPARKRPSRREAKEVEAEQVVARVRSFADEAIYLPTAKYYGRVVKLAVLVKSLKSEEGQWYADLEVHGTRDEELLRILSGKRSKVMNVHLCGTHCNQQLTDELVVHANEFEELTLKEESWTNNLRDVRVTPGDEDELQDLRREQERMEELDKRARKDEKKETKKRRRAAEEGRAGKSPRREAGGRVRGDRNGP